MMNLFKRLFKKDEGGNRSHSELLSRAGEYYKKEIKKLGAGGSYYSFGYPQLAHYFAQCDIKLSNSVDKAREIYERLMREVDNAALHHPFARYNIIATQSSQAYNFYSYDLGFVYSVAVEFFASIGDKSRVLEICDLASLYSKRMQENDEIGYSQDYDYYNECTLSILKRGGDIGKEELASILKAAREKTENNAYIYSGSEEYSPKLAEKFREYAEFHLERDMFFGAERYYHYARCVLEELFKKGEKYAEELVSIYLALGEVYRKCFRQERAQYYYDKAVSLAEKHAGKRRERAAWLSDIYIRVGAFYDLCAELNYAALFYEKAINVIKPIARLKKEYQGELAEALSLALSVYSVLGLREREIDLAEKILPAYEAALAEPNGDKYKERAACSISKAALTLAEQKPELAKRFIERALEIMEELRDEANLSSMELCEKINSDATYVYLTIGEIAISGIHYVRTRVAKNTAVNIKADKKSIAERASRMLAKTRENILMGKMQFAIVTLRHLERYLGRYVASSGEGHEIYGLVCNRIFNLSENRENLAEQMADRQLTAYKTLYLSDGKRYASAYMLSLYDAFCIIKDKRENIEAKNLLSEMKSLLSSHTDNIYIRELYSAASSLFEDNM